MVIIWDRSFIRSRSKQSNIGLHIWPSAMESLLWICNTSVADPGFSLEGARPKFYPPLDRIFNWLYYKPSQESPVGRASAWSHTVSGGIIAPGFESHQCLTGMWRWLNCHAGCLEVSRCHTRGESQEMCNIKRMPPLSSNKAEPTLALKPRGDVTRSPKQGYQWPHKKDSCPPKI